MQVVLLFSGKILVVCSLTCCEDASALRGVNSSTTTTVWCLPFKCCSSCSMYIGVESMKSFSAVRQSLCPPPPNFEEQERDVAVYY